MYQEHLENSDTVWKDRLTNGIRTAKTVNGVKHSYTLEGSKILRETWGTNNLVTLYDNEENVCGLVYNDEPYYFMKNLQGDVIAITDRSGIVVARYSYDAWGVCTIEQDSAYCIGGINPYRYRGYYYDSEIGMYYLQSRYYDPAVGRFVNADEAIFLGACTLAYTYNLFEYCGNQPINDSDESGNVSIGAIIGGIIGFGVGAILVPIFADLLKLKGIGRTIFIVAGVAAVTAIGALLGYYAGKALALLYAKGGVFATKLNQAVAKVIAKFTKASLKAASGNGWTLTLKKYTIRIMTEGGGRTNYIRISHATKGAMTILGKFSSDRALTHIPITIDNLVKLIQLMLKWR